MVPLDDFNKEMLKYYDPLGWVILGVMFGITLSHLFHNFLLSVSDALARLILRRLSK